MSTNSKKTDWVLSEESFLQLCCQIEEHSWGQKIYWPKNVDWPKLNFVRVLEKEITLDLFTKLQTENEEFFKSKNLSFNIKIPQSSQIDEEVKKKLIHKGIPLYFFKTKLLEEIDVSSEFQLKKVSTSQELENWWLIFSTYPTKEEKLQSPFYPVVKEAFRTGTEFFLGMLNNKAVHCFAYDKFDGEKYNLWGVATLEDYRRQGLFKKFQFLAFQQGHRPLEVYLQANEGGPLQLYYQKSTLTEVLEKESRYEIQE